MHRGRGAKIQNTVTMLRGPVVKGHRAEFVRSIALPMRTQQHCPNKTDKVPLKSRALPSEFLEINHSASIVYA